MKVIRAMVVGCGRVAQHYKWFLSKGYVNGIAVVGACDTHLDRAEKFCRPFGARPYQDYRQALSEVQPDLVLLLTESGKHYMHAVDIISRGCNIIIEKPVALIPEHAHDLDRLATKGGILCCVAFQNRYNKSIRRLKEVVDANVLGRISTIAVRLRWCRHQDYYEDGWHGTWAMDGGVISQQAIHHIDVLNWLFGPVEEVSAVCGRRLNSLEAEDTLVAIVRMENGSFATIEATTAARPADYEASLSVVAEKGLVEVGGLALNKVETWTLQGEDEKFVKMNYSEEVRNAYGMGHIPLLQEVVDKLRSGRHDSPISPSDAVRAVEIIHMLYASNELHRWVKRSENARSKYLGKKI